jgi:chloramphenicol 3-O-phosphotransferase
MIQPGDIVVITGIMAAGKSTVAQALAERLPRSVHLRGDIFRRFIVNGQAAVTPGNWTEAEQQLHMRYRIACNAAIAYAEAGFAVVYQDVILGTEVSRVLDLLRFSPGRIFLVVLAPAPEAAARRDRLRPKTGYTDWNPRELDHAMRTGTPRIGFWLDSSSLTVEETVGAVLANLPSAEVAPLPGKGLPRS